MRRRTVCILLVFTLMLLTIPAHAVTTRSTLIQPELSFSNTMAYCTLYVAADRTTDNISATIRLKHGTRTLATWTASDTGMLDFSDTATVSRNQTYTLIADVRINGTAYAPVSISGTNN